ncbi:hypothetical protein D3C78_1106920 [compost metagenome]
MKEEGDARGAAGQKADLVEEIKAERRDDGAGDDALHVFHRRMSGRIGTPHAVNASRYAHAFFLLFRYILHCKKQPIKMDK